MRLGIINSDRVPLLSLDAHLSPSRRFLGASGGCWKYAKDLCSLRCSFGKAEVLSSQSSLVA